MVCILVFWKILKCRLSVFASWVVNTVPACKPLKVITGELKSIKKRCLKSANSKIIS